MEVKGAIETPPMYDITNMVRLLMYQVAPSGKNSDVELAPLARWQCMGMKRNDFTIADIIWNVLDNSHKHPL